MERPIYHPANSSVNSYKTMDYIVNLSDEHM